MLGILFSAMAPAVSHAMSATGHGAAQVQICTMEGVKTIAVVPAAPDMPGKAIADHLLEHCAYCTAQGDPAALPPSSGAGLDVPLLLPSYPPLFYGAPHALFAWTAAHPRGPPFSI